MQSKMKGTAVEVGNSILYVPTCTCTLYMYMYTVHVHVHCTCTCTLYMYCSWYSCSLPSGLFLYPHLALLLSDIITCMCTVDCNMYCTCIWVCFTPHLVTCTCIVFVLFSFFWFCVSLFPRTVFQSCLRGKWRYCNSTCTCTCDNYTCSSFCNFDVFCRRQSNVQMWIMNLEGTRTVLAHCTVHVCVCVYVPFTVCVAAVSMLPLFVFS